MLTYLCDVPLTPEGFQQKKTVSCYLKGKIKMSFIYAVAADLVLVVCQVKANLFLYSPVLLVKL